MWHVPAAVMLTAALLTQTPTSQAPPVEVIFSVPGAGEAGVGLATPIRLQFSAHLDASSLDGQITLGYSEEESRDRGEPEPPSIAFTAAYDGADRALTIRPTGRWERFREVRLTLGDGIRGAAGQPLRPYSLVFSTGGS